MIKLSGKVAFVTGGASGIGLAIAKAFVDAGMKVVIADLRQDHLDNALALFDKHSHLESVHAIKLDVTDRQAMAAAADETERHFGKLHVLVNNAGIGIQGPFNGITYADWDFGLAVNLGGVINGIQTFLPRIRAHREGGYVINTASLQALANVPAQFIIYATTKAAVVTLSETLHHELATENIGVSVLCPGPVRTNIHEIAKNRPPQFGVGEAYRAAEEAGGSKISFPSWLSPDTVADMVMQAMKTNQLYVITHGEWRTFAEARHTAVIAAMPDKLDPLIVALINGQPVTESLN
jgi:NAD(P)-dependent dehydrogenase (short-subunit alcohol dehydrogenase family)